MQGTVPDWKSVLLLISFCRWKYSHRKEKYSFYTTATTDPTTDTTSTTPTSATVATISYYILN